MPVGQDDTQRITGLRHRAGLGTRAGGANNHGRAGGAIAGAMLGAAAALLPALVPGLVLLAPPALAQPEDNPLVQRNVPAEATAENAVVARDRALAAGQRIAYERMAAAMGLPRTASDAQIEAQVASLVIESERITPRGYAARITVNFRAPGAGMATPAAPPPVPGRLAGGPTLASLEAVARYRSLGEYIEIKRRLEASGAVTRVDVVTVSGEAARLRLGLRSPPMEAAAELGRGGIALAPMGAAAGAAEAWQLGLAGGR